MRESYSFNIPKEHGIVPLSSAQDGAIDASKHRIKMFAEDMSRVLRGEKGKHKWQLVDAAGKPTDLKTAIAALDEKPKHRLPSTRLPENKAAQKRASTVSPLERQQQSQTDKAALIQRLYGGGGTLEKKLWPNS